MAPRILVLCVKTFSGGFLGFRTLLGVSGLIFGPLLGGLGFRTLFGVSGLGVRILFRV